LRELIVSFVSGRLLNPATEISGPNSTGTDKSVRKVVQLNSARIQFRDLAKFAWPHKTEYFLAELTGADPRTCRRWLADRNEPPADALGVVLCEIMRRFHQRD
jgi:hypothetical protein